MENCRYYSDECKGVPNASFNDASKLKFKFLEKYFEQWCYKVVGFYFTKKNPKADFIKLKFFDVMASSGLYYDEKSNSMIEGTAYLIMNAINKTVGKLKKQYNKRIDIELIFNDKEYKFVSCLNCVKNNILNQLEVANGVNIEIKCVSGDRNQIINNYFSKGDMLGDYNLFVYDPYNVDFEWEYLSKVISAKNTDIIITHFFPNDIKRAINTKMNIEKELKYSNSYNVAIDYIRNKFNDFTSSNERTEFFRFLLDNKVKEYTDKRTYIAPCILPENKTHLYDIMCISNSHHAGVILKDEMCKLYFEIKEHEDKQKSEQFTLFDSHELIDANKVGTEYNARYDIDRIRAVFQRDFAGKIYETEKEFKKALELHDILPSTPLTKLYKDKGLYRTEQTKTGSNRYICSKEKV